MNDTVQLSRRNFMIGGALAAAIGGAGCSSSRASAISRPASSAGATSTPSADRPARIAYCTLFDQGAWAGPTNADGSPSLAIINEIFRPRGGEAIPQYVRLCNAGTAASTTGSSSTMPVSQNALVRYHGTGQG